MRQVRNLERNLYRNLRLQNNTFRLLFVYAPHLFNVSFSLFQWLNKVLFLIIYFNGDNKAETLLFFERKKRKEKYCREKYTSEAGCLKKNRINIHGQNTRQPQYKQINVDEPLFLCSIGEFQIFPFLQIKEENKLLRKAY